LGSVTHVLNEQGQPTAYTAYNEFGVPRMRTGATIPNLGSGNGKLTGAGLDQPGTDDSQQPSLSAAYTGHPYDDRTGMYYAQARYYMPQIGRFISEDPWQGDVFEPRTQNPYPYVLNQPFRYVDPSGMVGLAVPILGKLIGDGVGAIIVGAGTSAAAGGAAGGLIGGALVWGLSDPYANVEVPRALTGNSELTEWEQLDLSEMSTEEIIQAGAEANASTLTADVLVDSGNYIRNLDKQKVNAEKARNKRNEKERFENKQERKMKKEEQVTDFLLHFPLVDSIVHAHPPNRKEDECDPSQCDRQQELIGT
jgi:RHS repeat-associated protein